MTPEQAIRVCAGWCGWYHHVDGKSTYWSIDTDDDMLWLYDSWGNDITRRSFADLAEQCRVELQRRWRDVKEESALMDWWAEQRRYEYESTPIVRLMALAAVLEGE